MSLTAYCFSYRSISPAALGHLFSWSLTNVKRVEENKHPLGFPFNQYFTFFVISLFATVAALLTLKLPRQRDDNDYEALALDDN